MRFHYPFYIRWLSPFLNLPREVLFNENSIQLITNKGRLEFVYSEVERDVETRPSILSTRDVQVRVGRRPFTVPYLSQSDSDILGRSIKTHVNNWHKRHYDQHIAGCKKAKEGINAFVKGSSGYVRASQFKKFFASLNLPQSQAILYRDLLSDDDFKLAEQIEKFRTSPRQYLRYFQDEFVKREIQRYGHLFEELNESQKKACVINDDTNLVLAGAGTGKTKTMVSRAKYLVESGTYTPDQILMLAYGSKAKEEMEERLEGTVAAGVTVKTFHGYGRYILESFCGRKMKVDKIATDDKEQLKFISNCFENHLSGSADYQAKAIRYFDSYLYPYRNPFDFKSLGEYYDYIKSNEIRAFSKDKVRSYEEVAIANFLYKNQIKFVYEPYYRGNISTVGFTSYRPDFYLPDYGIYIEHFGVNEKMQAPKYMDPVKYEADMDKKRQVHDMNGTKLLETYSYQQSTGTLLQVLEGKLKDEGVEFSPLAQDQYLVELREFGAVSKLSKLINDALGTSRTMKLSIADLKSKANGLKNQEAIVAMIDLIEPIAADYQNYLNDKEAIDFDTMVNEAISLIEAGEYIPPFKAVMIDEYQDISPPRAALIKAMQKVSEGITIYGVGDDWQGIYRFSGADLNLTYRFFHYFGEGTETRLDETYRFNKGVSDVATTFVTKNTKQKRKQFKSRPTDRPTVHIVRTTQNEQQEKIQEVIHWLAGNCEKGSILLLNRYRYKKPKYLYVLIKLARELGFSLTFESGHSSKGKEADYVILMDMKRGRDGFPAEKIDHPLIEMMLPKLEEYKFAEERRVFYVTLTRCKEHVFIMSHEESASPFTTELKAMGELVSTDTLEPSNGAAQVTSTACPTCETGVLVARSNGSFQSCSNFPLCDYKHDNCPRCKSPRKRVNRYHVCTSDMCDWRAPVCPKCDGDLVYRTNGPYQPFWGCSKFPRCDGQAKRHEFERLHRERKTASN